MTTF
jgi:WD40 repeat protein